MSAVLLEPPTAVLPNLWCPDFIRNADSVVMFVRRTAVVTACTRCLRIFFFRRNRALLAQRSARAVGPLRAGFIDDIGKMASQLGAKGPAKSSQSLFGGCPDPSWRDLCSAAIATTTGVSLGEKKR